MGYGLEGELTDVFTRRVLDDIMRPFFRAGQYYDGILASVAALQQKIPLGLEQEEVAQALQPSERSRGRSLGQNLFLFFIIVLFLIFSVFSRLLGFGGGHRGGGYYGGGLFGGGRSGGSSWGGGGGGFGGGGSSSSW